MITHWSVIVLGLLCLAPSQGEAGPVVKPAAPGGASRAISATESRSLAVVEVQPADVRFMQNMIIHHAQAVEMVSLIAARSSNRDLALLGRRIALTQEGEIALMQRWPSSRGQPADNARPHHHAMSGMLTEQQMQALADARGKAFDRLFLEGMIQHHKGAITMVESLLARPGAAQESEIDQFVGAVVPDQSAEIARMRQMLKKL